jgi:YD repeat-containing protein
LRKTADTNANLEVVRYQYKPSGDLWKLIDGKNQTNTWSYDQYGRVTNKVDQASVEILRYTYDANSRLTNRWSKAKLNTKYKYDAVGNLTNVDYNASTDIRLAYDALNRLTNMVDAAGTTAYKYYAGGLLRTEDGPWASDTVTNYYNTARMRSGLGLQQPTGASAGHRHLTGRDFHLHLQGSGQPRHEPRPAERFPDHERVRLGRAADQHPALDLGEFAPGRLRLRLQLCGAADEPGADGQQRGHQHL